MPGRSTNTRKAVRELISELRKVFKKYTRNTRKEAWKAITSKKGERFINKLLTDPTLPIIGVERALRFKEWMEIREANNFNFDE